MKQLEKDMYECARNLEFERAAQLRDELEQIRDSVFKQGTDAVVAVPAKKQGKTVA
jgi:excinuclease UvrABC nuclease subunit